MAKSTAVQSAMSSTSAPAPAQVVPPSAPSRATATANMQSIADIRDVDVLEWGNGEPAGESSEPPPAMARGGVEPPPDRFKPQKGEPDHPDELAARAKPQDEREETQEAAESKVTETSAEKRARALVALSSEKKARQLEAQLKETQGKLSASEKLTLGELLKARGVNKDDLLEKLLTGSDDLGLPPKLEGDAKDKADMAAKLKELSDRLEARDKADQERNIAEGLRVVEAELKDVGVPLVESLGEYSRVMNEAYAMWQAAGSEGSARDHLPAAAAKVENALRTKHPRLAALADAAEKVAAAAPAARAAAFAPAPKAGITRRVGSKPLTGPAKLPDDPHDRDLAIKREMGWKVD